MRAILLAAGVGKRMGPGSAPKCLLTLKGRSLLRILFDSLRAVGIHHVVLVVGYRKEEVIAEAKAQAGSLRLELIENPRYREGAILSLWAARGSFGDDLLIMDADVLCPLAGLERLVRSPFRNGLLVDSTANDTGEEQIVLGGNDRVAHITKQPSEELKRRMTVLGESVGFLKLSKEGAALLGKLLEEKVRQGVTQIEHEQVYPELFRQVPVGFERMDGLAWMEIDTPEDLERAEQEIYPRWFPPVCLNRRMADWFLPVVLKLPLTPNQWTFLSLLCGWAFCFAVAQGDYRSGLWGALLFEIFYLIDNWDGEVARFKGLSSRWGGWFDVVVDTVVQGAFPLALALGLRRIGAPPWVIPLGAVASFGMLMDFGVTLWAKVRGFGPAVYGDPSRGKTVLSDSRLKSWIRANLTNENFSLMVVAVLVVNGQWPFLWALAVGSHLFWIGFLWRERQRLLGAVLPNRLR